MSLESNIEPTQMDSSELKNWLEYDYNPFFLFGTAGEVVYLNRSAELLSGYEPVKTFNDLALSYASIDFGYKTTFMPLNFGKFSFFAITVGYEDEEHIGIKLYQSPAVKEPSAAKLKSYESTNIYVLIDINIALAKSRLSQSEFKNEFDPSIPEFRLSQNDFSKVLRRAYETFGVDNSTLKTVLKLKTGEFLYVQGQRYPLVEMIISGQDRSSRDDAAIEALSSSINIGTHFETDCLSLEIPMVT